MKKLISTNPSENYTNVGEVNVSTNNEIVEKVDLANRTKYKWKNTDLSKRIKIVNSI